MVTAYGTVEKVVEAMKKGADNYLIKPINLDELEVTIKKSLEKKSIISENQQLKEEISEKYNFSQIIYGSKSMEEAMSMAARVAPTKASVLIRGESGYRERTHSQGTHYASPRKTDPLLL